ncbi:hypothetical protein [Candidatus Pristimantibacillus sp. PTI5]|uniref:hypothetical protein n=1 Tax=Candidatus Pristimantibacillus sp. PTI5 TaxID=3400422 RepID=UPI003B018F6F
MTEQWSLKKWGLLGAIAFLFGFMQTIFSGVNFADESWFLQVAHRISHGEVLYRDVFFGATPLPAQIASFFVQLAGSEILVTKALRAICFALNIVLSCLIINQMTRTKQLPLFLIAALLIYTPPGVGSLYSSLANVFFLSTILFVFLWKQARFAKAEKGSSSARLAAIVGLCASLCFAAKQNLGIYVIALAAVLMAMHIIVKPKTGLVRIIKDLAVVAAAFLFTLFLSVAPLLINGGFAEFIDYGFLNKKNYLVLAEIPYFEGLQLFFYNIIHLNTYEDFRQVFLDTIFIFPLLSVLSLLLMFIFSAKDQRGLVFAAFLIAITGWAGMLPRVDRNHISYVMPELLIGVAFVWYQLKPRLPSLARKIMLSLLILWGSWGLYQVYMEPLLKIPDPDYQVSSLPHYKWTILPTPQHMEILQEIRFITDHTAQDETVFFLSPFAGAYYLITDKTNVTPFDLSYATAFGLHGEEQVMDAITKGKIDVVFVDHRMSYMPILQPDPLLQFVKENMLQAETENNLTIYRAS